MIAQIIKKPTAYPSKDARTRKDQFIDFKGYESKEALEIIKIISKTVEPPRPASVPEEGLLDGNVGLKLAFFGFGYAMGLFHGMMGR